MTAALQVRRVRLDDDPDGRGQWDVLDGGRVVGHVAEHRQWLGDRHGPARFDVACRPEPEPAPACWNALDVATIPEALDLLADHRSEAHSG